ncbi:wax ester synthase/diacylglycerol acyltransferase 4-like [Magnolia sinica]|uniref:wax ester synthase/diacylglycerol acyltransferase 4-like n=1 Tax=Magnolia sinica TaxID=86752 RepID=UPI00265A7927|nr:wax ester synthase/diacylglycerol acyltransferase 4-like [Magnolia sinica]
MASNQKTNAFLAEEEFQPASPSSEYLNSSVLSLTILAVFESEIPIDDSATITLLRDQFLPINTRFSSILVRDEKGRQVWKRAHIHIEDHVKVPHFPAGLPPDSYDGYLQDYLSKIALEQLPNNRPLWEIHIIKYPTSDAPGTIVFKLHHALGDGFSLMGALFSYLKRADDPSLPLTFPSSYSSKTGSETSRGSIFHICNKVSNIVAGCWYTASDFVSSVLHSTLLEDDRTVIRSGTPQVEFKPISISTVTFSLDRVREIKSRIAGTVNDVVVGVIFYAIQLYKQKMVGHRSDGGERMTALVLLNTRMINGYQSVNDMLSQKTWGNHFTFLPIPIPCCKDTDNENPLKFINKAKETIKRKKNSLAVYLTGRLLDTLRSIRGPKAVSRYSHSTLKNTSIAISHMVGPKEKLAIGGHPIKGLYFTVVGAPQSLALTILSYMGNLRVMVAAEKGFINSQLLVSCLKEAYHNIYREACGIEITETK